MTWSMKKLMENLSAIKHPSSGISTSVHIIAFAVLCLFCATASSGSSPLSADKPSDKQEDSGATPAQEERRPDALGSGERHRSAPSNDGRYSVTPMSDVQHPHSNSQPPAFTEALQTPAQTVYMPDANHYDYFGYSVSLSADGTTLVASVPHESRRQRTSNPDSGGIDNTAASSGAVVVYARSSGHWSEQAWLKPEDSSAGDGFGYSLSVSADGALLAVGAPSHRQRDIVVAQSPLGHRSKLIVSGLTYVFARSETGGWIQTALLKSIEPDRCSNFGASVTFSGDGRVLAVGCDAHESETQTAHLFARSKGLWVHKDTLEIRSPRESKDDNPSPLALNHDGSLLAAGVPDENTILFYERDSRGWQPSESLTLPKSETLTVHDMGMSIALNGTGSRLATSAYELISHWKIAEESAANCDIECRTQKASRQQKREKYCLTLYREKNCLEPAIAMSKLFYPVLYIYERTEKGWQMQTRQRLLPGIPVFDFYYFVLYDYEVSMSQDGRTVVVGGFGDDIPATAFAHTEEEGVPVIEDEIFVHKENVILKRKRNYGAAWLTVLKDGTWQELVRFQAPIPEQDDRFGHSVSINANGQTIAIGAPRRDTSRGNRPALISFDDDIHDAGSVFVYHPPSIGE